MTSTTKYFEIARKVAIKGSNQRRYRLGAVGLRADGAVVTACNLSNRTPEPKAHAEYRLVRKLDWGSIVYVVRIYSDGRLATARPCQHCENTMRLRGVRYCYYSINDTEHGVLIL